MFKLLVFLFEGSGCCYFIYPAVHCIFGGRHGVGGDLVKPSKNVLPTISSK